MRFALMTEPQQGLTYDEQLAIARRAEAAGFEAFFRSDHYQSFPGPSGLPTTDAWTVLAGLARETERIGLGALVSPVTFRQSGNLAKVVTTVDEMSGGRIEFGLGAGWHDVEHAQLGLPFPEISERGDMLEENLEVLLGLWGEPDGWSYEGKHVRIRDAQFYPKPVAVPGRPDAAERRVAAADPRRWRRDAAVDADRRPLRRRVQPLVVVAGRRAGRSTGSLRRRARRPAAIPGRSPARRCRGC